MKIFDWFKLFLAAGKFGFPMREKKYYLYMAGLNLGSVNYKRWWDFAKKNGFDLEKLRPIHQNGEFVATYKLIRSYRVNCGSDLAYGDSGRDGDFVLERIDKILEI